MMRIAILSSNVIRIPPTPPDQWVPPGWSGAPELIAHHITEELVKRGHHVTLFASGNSQTNARLVSVTKQATWKTIGIGPHKEYERMLISKAYKMANQGEFDIIHSHFDIRTAPFAPLTSTPTLSTLHSPLEGITADILRNFRTTQYYASISNSQREDLPDLQYAGTVYNGIEIDTIPFSEKKDNYLIYAGRISQVKGVADAIEVAKRTNNQLRIYGSADERDEYWLQEIKPHIDGDHIQYLGMIPRDELFVHIGHAKAFLFPLHWKEPFGLVTVEAAATGTPTIAYSHGALPEIIENGVTGFLVNTQEEMIKAIEKIDTINLRACRDRAERLFSISAMVDGYEKLYQKILS